MEQSELPPPTPVFRAGLVCPHCFGKGTTIAASDVEIDLVCNACGREWTAERQHSLTPYNPPK